MHRETWTISGKKDVTLMIKANFCSNSETLLMDYQAVFTAKKFGALAALTAQNTALVLVTKFSMSRVGITPYLASTVIACSESLKLIISCFFLAHADGKPSLFLALRDLRSNGARLALPSVLYVIQNNLLFKAVRSLSPTLYMVCSQSKILTSALFSALLLNSRITRRQCFALVALLVGMILVHKSESDHAAEEDFFSFTRDSDVSSGLLALFAATFISGFAGAYLEKIYKSSDGKSGDPHSVWFRNTQLACFSVPVALVNVYWRERARIGRDGYFQGFDIVVALVVALQATGGLVVALVMRHAGNILKCFAVSISMCNCVVFTFLVSMDRTDVSTLSMGLALVVTATFAYSL